MRSRTTRFILAAVVMLSTWSGLAPAAQAKSPGPDNKWRIVCMHDARSDGVIVFRLTPVGGESQELKVTIKEGTFENDVARQVREVFKNTLPKEVYHVERDDGEAVLVKKKRGQPDFLLEFVSLSVNGLGIRVELD